MADNVDKLVEDFRSSKLTRRDFLHRALLLTGSLAAATTLADAIAPESSHAGMVDPNDPALASSEVKYNATDGVVLGGYLTRPKSDGARPAVVVIHPWSGIDGTHSRRGAKICQSGVCCSRAGPFVAPRRHQFVCESRRGDCRRS